MATAPRTQAERSQSTQKRVLDATLDVIMDYGLRDASTVLVCRHANISRGALLHHYPTKEALLQEALRHLLKDEIDSLMRMVDEVDAGNLDVHGFLAVLWEHFSGRLFMISLEYIVAARTDPAIRKALTTVALEFNWSLDEVWERLMAHSRLEPRERRLALNATTCLMRGMSAHGIWRDDPQLFEDMLEFWKETLIKAGVIDPPAAKRSRDRARQNRDGH